jgi:glutamine synthetase adenylyltransferase
MSNEDKMNIDERYKYLRRMRKRYIQAGRKEQGRLLDEMEAVTELHRKSLIRRMNGSLERHPRQSQRGRTYGSEVSHALRVIAESFDYLCAERLTPNLVWMANHLAAHDELEVSDHLLDKLDQVSVSTVQRILARIPRDKPRLPRKGPQRTRKLTQDIPMRRIPWNEQQPGYLETDLVHHCGPSPSGEYVCTIQTIDVATG